MRRRGNRDGPFSGIAGLCLMGVLPVYTAAEAAPAPEIAPVVEVAPAPAPLNVPAIPLVEQGELARSLWVPRGSLPAERADRVPVYCGGAYPSFIWPYPRNVDPEGYPIRTASERAAYLIDGDMELEGGVRIEQGNRTVRAARARIDQRTREGTVSGGMSLQEPGVVMQGDEARVNLDTHAATLEGVEFVLLDNAFRGEARTLSQDGGGNMTMDRGWFTRCEPGNDNWRLSASSVEVEEGEVFGTARNAVLRVKQVPVFYTPYMRFPVTDDRQSGWLFPNLAYSDEDGYDISLPYYFNLAPNYDATLMPRYVSERGAGAEGQFRHLSGWQETVLSAAYLHKDDLYDGELSRKDFRELSAEGAVTGEFQPEDRWLYAMEHLGGFGDFSTVVDYTAVSDRDYFRDLGSDLGVSSQIELERRGEIQYASNGLNVRLWAQRFQRLDERSAEPYQRLPELDVSYLGELPGPLEWSVGSSLVTFTRENDMLSGLNAAVGDRVHVEPRLRLPFLAPWGFLTLTGGYRYTRYDLRDVPDALDPEPERTIGVGSAHGGLYFERDLDLFGAGLVQTLEPQVYYLYQEFEDQTNLPRFDASNLTFSFSQLFRDNRFAGLDRIGDANQASVGVTTRFLDAETGREHVRASLGAINYFRDRRVTLSGNVGEEQREPTSPVAGELAARVADAWSATASLVWDPHDGEWQEGAVGVQYRGDNRHIVNMGYRKRLQGNIQQTDLSVYWPVSRHYAVIGRWNYDVESGRTIEGFGGIEYNDCCWRIRLMARRFLDSPSGRNLDTAEVDEGILLQVVFKGLAGLGDKIESVLQRGIRGYRTETMDDY